MFILSEDIFCALCIVSRMQNTQWYFKHTAVGHFQSNLPLWFIFLLPLPRADHTSNMNQVAEGGSAVFFLPIGTRFFASSPPTMAMSNIWIGCGGKVYSLLACFKLMFGNPDSITLEFKGQKKLTITSAALWLWLPLPASCHPLLIVQPPNTSSPPSLPLSHLAFIMNIQAVPLRTLPRYLRRSTHGHVFNLPLWWKWPRNRPNSKTRRVEVGPEKLFMTE